MPALGHHELTTSQQPAAALLLRPPLHQAGRRCWVLAPPSPTLSCSATPAQHRSHRHQPWRGLQRRWSAAQRKIRMPRTSLPGPSSNPRSSSGRSSSAGPRNSRRTLLPWRRGGQGAWQRLGVCVRTRGASTQSARAGDPPPAAASMAPARAAGLEHLLTSRHTLPPSVLILQDQWCMKLYNI